MRTRSTAAKAGLEEGDIVISIDGQDVTNKTHGDATKLIEMASEVLVLQLHKYAISLSPLLHMYSLSRSTTVADKSL